MADVATVVDKWERNMLSAQPSMKAGVMAVRVSPTAKAADAADLYLRRVQEAVASGKYQDGLRSVSLQAWQQATVDKTAQRLASGVKAGKSKVQAFQQQFQPHVEMVKNAIAAMPKGGEAEADARMLAAVKLMRQFKFMKRAG